MSGEMPPIAVLAGGLATRLGEVTRSVPKAMLIVAGRPFIGHQLAHFKAVGITRVVLCTGHLASQIHDFVGDGAAFGLQVQYSPDGPTLMGTGGAIRQALPLLGEHFLVIYGDSLLHIPFQPVVCAFRAAGKPGLMTVLHNAGRWDTSNVEFAGGRIIEYSKRPTPRMAHIDYGLSVLSAAAFGAMPAGEKFDLSTLYQRMVAAGEMAGYEVTERFYEIGSVRGLAETEAYLNAISLQRTP